MLHPRLPGRAPAWILPLLGLAVAPVATAQQVILEKEDYLVPAAKVADVLTSDAMHNRVSLSNLGPDGEHFLVSRSGGMPPLERMARPYLNLGETAIDHRADRARQLTTGYTVGYDLVSHKTGETISIRVNAGMTVSGGSFSPDGKRVGFVGNADDGSYLYVADVPSGRARRVSDRKLLASLVTSFDWTWDSRQMLAVLVPENRGERPQRHEVANEPQVWNTEAGKSPSRVYRFLLKSPHDKRMLEYLTTGQLALVNVEDGKVTPVGKPAMFTRIEVAPDSSYFRVSTMQKPFSYFVPMRSFGSKEELWNGKGEVVHTFSTRELRTNAQQQQQQQPPQRGGGRGGPGNAGKRGLAWRPDGKGYSFLELEPEKKKPEADKKADAGKDAGKADAGKKDTDKKDAAKKDAGKKDPGKTDADKPKTDAPAQPPAQQPGQRIGRRPTGARGARRGPGARRGDRPGGRDGAPRGGEGRPARREDGPKRKDRVMLWHPPYSDKSVKVVWESDDPIQSVAYSEDCRTLYVTQQKDGKRLVFAVDLKEPTKTKKIIEEKQEAGPEGAQQQPQQRFRQFLRRGGRGGGGGGLMSKRGSRGGSVVRTSKDGKFVYTSGTDQPGKEEQGKVSPRPYIDRIEIGTGKKERLWQADGKTTAESLSAVLDDDMDQLVISRESRTEVPNSFRWDRKTKQLEQLTHNVDPAPEVTAARRERFQVTRVDGFKFWVDVTIPRYYGTRLPALFWFYPREFTSQKAYDDRQRPRDPNQFPATRTRSMSLLTMLGYVVVEPDCPIVGEEGRMNDNYVADLRNSLWAVIDDLDKRQIIDRDRLAIGGHSYGAFSTANALVHTPFFKAGIAGDGNYNRTLTPMAFQSERRFVWDARETYLQMSPILWANQVNGALLMYHGMDDSNTGTHPMHAPMLFRALNGLGKKAALYMYPYEGHGPGAQETVLDLWSRWIEWLDIHVKDPGRAGAKPKKASGVDITEARASRTR